MFYYEAFCSFTGKKDSHAMLVATQNKRWTVVTRKLVEKYSRIA